jgi:hypothetical protein
MRPPPQPYRGGMDESRTNLSYRTLELLCRQQAQLSATPEAREELERMALEYKQLADWQDHQWPKAKE